MAKQTIKVSINLDGLRAELQRSLQKSIYLVSAGLQTKDKITPELLQLPTNIINVAYANSLNWNTEEAQEQYSEWVLSNGFRDLIESVNIFLESAHRVLSFFELEIKRKEGVVLKGTDWNEIINTGEKKFHRLGLPLKLKHIREKHGISFDRKFGEQLISINTARNCFVHRNGVIAECDLNTNTALEVKWTGMSMILQNEDGEKELIIGEIVEKDSVLVMRNQEEIKSFTLGQRISFSAKEYASMSWCLFLFGNNLVQAISNFGAENGILKKLNNESA